MFCASLLWECAQTAHCTAHEHTRAPSEGYVLHFCVREPSYVRGTEKKKRSSSVQSFVIVFVLLRFCFFSCSIFHDGEFRAIVDHENKQFD